MDGKYGLKFWKVKISRLSNFLKQVFVIKFSRFHKIFKRCLRETKNSRINFFEARVNPQKFSPSKILAYTVAYTCRLATKALEGACWSLIAKLSTSISCACMPISHGLTVAIYKTNKLLTAIVQMEPVTLRKNTWECHQIYSALKLMHKNSYSYTSWR